jgi:hypothetical protein
VSIKTVQTSAAWTKSIKDILREGEKNPSREAINEIPFQTVCKWAWEEIDHLENMVVKMKANAIKQAALLDQAMTLIDGLKGDQESLISESQKACERISDLGSKR